MLLRVPQVQAELKVTDEQKKQLDAYFGESRATGMRELMEKLRDMSEEERRKEFQKIREQRKKEATERLGKILDEKQLARLDGIRLQLQGFSVLGDRKVIEKLGITREQGVKLKELRDQMQQFLQKLFEGMREAPREERGKLMQGIGEKARDIQQHTMEKAIREVLTTTQAKQLKEMMGAPFELDLRELFRGGMFRSGRPGGGSGGGPGGSRPEQ
jgi:hypothetical protein